MTYLLIAYGLGSVCSCTLCAVNVGGFKKMSPLQWAFNLALGPFAIALAVIIVSWDLLGLFEDEVERW